MSIISTVNVPKGIAMAADSRLIEEQKQPDGVIHKFIMRFVKHKMLNP